MRKDVICLFVTLLVLSFLTSFAHAQIASQETVRTRAVACVAGGLESSSSITLNQAIFSGLAGFDNSKIDDAFDDAKSSGAECYIPDGGSSCSIKTTAQVFLAKQKLGQDTTGIISWLGNQSGAVQGLIWYLQITMDNNQPATCTVNYNNQDYSVSIDANMRLSGSVGSCLSVADDGYRLRIQDNCLDNTYRVTCDPINKTSFKTNLLYKQGSGSSVLFVSPQTNSAQYPDFTEHEIDAKCFRSNGVCDYEGSLWATTALYRANTGYETYVPYLRALSEQNEKYFPIAFLSFILSGDNDAAVINELRPDLNSGGSYWDITGSPYTRFYDTALGMLGDTSNSANVLPYLASQQGETDGCFGGNIADTAFIIHAAGWSEYDTDFCSVDGDCSSGYSCLNGVCVNTAPCSSNSDCGNGEICSAGQCIDSNAVCLDVGGTCRADCNSDESEISAQCTGTGQECCVPSGGNGGGPTIPDGSTCEDVGATCRADCNTNEQAVNASCENTADACCYADSGSGGGGGGGSIQTDCSLAGYYCAPDFFSCIEANGQDLDSSEYYCNTFVEVCCTVDVPDQVQSCFNLGGEVCSADETCSGSTVGSSDGSCCLDSCETESSGGGGSTPQCLSDSQCGEDEECSLSEICVSVDGGGGGWFWIILLILLIAIVVLAIVFRDHLKIWWFKIRGKKGGNKGTPPNRPGPPRGLPPHRGPPQFGPRPGFPMRPGHGPQPVRRPSPAPPQRPVKRSNGPKDPEMEETLKKLKEISK